MRILTISQMLATVVLCRSVFCGEIQGAAKTGDSNDALAVVIIEAARVGDVAKVNALLAGNPDLANAKENRWNITPLHAAVQLCHKDVAEILLAHGANVNAKDNFGGNTPLHWSVRTCRMDMVELLLVHKADVSAKDNNGDTPLHVTANKDVAEFLLAHRANINAEDSNDLTPLHFAAADGHKDVVELLLTHGAKVNATGKSGWSPLHFAAFRGHRDVVELLLAHGANLNAIDTNGRTPLHEAAKWSYKDVLEFSTSNVDGRNDALLAAAIQNHKTVVELLLAHKADMNIKDKDGKTPLELAESSSNENVVVLLRQHGGK